MKAPKTTCPHCKREHRDHSRCSGRRSSIGHVQASPSVPANDRERLWRREVRIDRDGDTWTAVLFFVKNSTGEAQGVRSKSFKSERGAKKWAAEHERGG